MSLRIALALTCSLAASFATAQYGPAGAEWVQLDATTKKTYVIAFAHGHNRGAQHQRNKERRKDCGPPPAISTTAEGIERFNKDIDCLTYTGQVYSDLKASDADLLVAGLDDLFRDYANQRIAVSQALELVQERISGLKTDAEFQSMVETLRMFGAPRPIQ